MQVPLLESPYGASHLTRELVLSLGTGFQRIVVGDQDILGTDLPAMNGPDLVFQDVGIVVEIVGRELAGNLQEFGGDLHASRGGDFSIDSGSSLSSAARRQ